MRYINEWIGQGQIVSKKKITIPDPRQDYYVTDLVIICKRQIKGTYKGTFIPCEAWGQFSDYCDKLEIGDKIKVRGRFENKAWRGKDGENYKKNLVVIEDITKLT